MASVSPSVSKERQEKPPDPPGDSQYVHHDTIPVSNRSAVGNADVCRLPDWHSHFGWSSSRPPDGVCDNFISVSNERCVEATSVIVDDLRLSRASRPPDEEIPSIPLSNVGC